MRKTEPALQHYTVEGHWPFPVDMLRRDDAQAATPEDQTKIDRLSGETSDNGYGLIEKVQINLTRIGRAEPNYERWLSYTWRVVTVPGVRDAIPSETSEGSFVWVINGHNDGEPTWLGTFGDYTANVNKDCGTGLFNYRVNNMGAMNFPTADAAKAAAEKDMSARLAKRMRAARRTLELFGGPRR